MKDPGKTQPFHGGRGAGSGGDPTMTTKGLLGVALSAVAYSGWFRLYAIATLFVILTVAMLYWFPIRRGACCSGLKQRAEALRVGPACSRSAPAPSGG